MPDLLLDLADDGALERLAGLDEAGQARVHRHLPLDAAGEQRLLVGAVVAPGDERDHRRRQAGERLQPARRAAHRPLAGAPARSACRSARRSGGCGPTRRAARPARRPATRPRRPGRGRRSRSTAAPSLGSSRRGRRRRTSTAPSSTPTTWRGHDASAGASSIHTDGPDDVDVAGLGRAVGGHRQVRTDRARSDRRGRRLAGSRCDDSAHRPPARGRPPAPAPRRGRRSRRRGGRRRPRRRHPSRGQPTRRGRAAGCRRGRPQRAGVAPRPDEPGVPARGRRRPPG